MGHRWLVTGTGEQNDAIVADYFAMHAEDISGRPYSKAEHNRLLLAMIGRPCGWIEYSHQDARRPRPSGCPRYGGPKRWRLQVTAKAGIDPPFGGVASR